MQNGGLESLEFMPYSLSVIFVFDCLKITVHLTIDIIPKIREDIKSKNEGSAKIQPNPVLMSMLKKNRTDIMKINKLNIENLRLLGNSI